MQERRVERSQVVEPPVDGYAEERTERVVQDPSGRVVESAQYRPVTPAPTAVAADEVHATAYDPYANRGGPRTSWCRGSGYYSELSKASWPCGSF